MLKINKLRSIGRLFNRNYTNYSAYSPLTLDKNGVGLYGPYFRSVPSELINPKLDQLTPKTLHLQKHDPLHARYPSMKNDQRLLLDFLAGTSLSPRIIFVTPKKPVLLHDQYAGEEVHWPRHTLEDNALPISPVLMMMEDKFMTPHTSLLTSFFEWARAVANEAIDKPIQRLLHRSIDQIAEKSGVEEIKYYKLMRTDANNNTFEVATELTENEAKALYQDYVDKNHKQVYNIEEISKPRSSSTFNL